MTLTIGEPCQTPSGDGTVSYWRYAPPDFMTIAAVSVRLAAQPPRFIPHQGSIFPAADVRVQRGGVWVAVAS
jgi:hypothetical protein